MKFYKYYSKHNNYKKKTIFPFFVIFIFNNHDVRWEIFGFFFVYIIMAPCLLLLKSIFSQPDTSDDQEQWEYLLTTLKSNKLTLTETPVDLEPPLRSTEKKKIPIWDCAVKDVKITSETDDLAYGVGTIKRRRIARSKRNPGFGAAPDEEDEEYAQIHLENYEYNRQRMVIVTANRTIKVESKSCGVNCRQWLGTSIETKSSADPNQNNSKKLYNVKICNCRNTTGCC